MEPASAQPQALARTRRAELALLGAALLWGCSFTWAKAGGEAINQAAGLRHGALGPIVLLGARFTLAGLIMLAAVPAARRGWSRVSLRRTLGVGLLLSAATLAQNVGLDFTSEATSAFLTSLVVLVVPVLSLVLWRKAPPRGLWAGVILALVGTALMTRPEATGFGLGEWLNLLCAVLFSFYILTVNAILGRDDPWRMAAGQFLVLGLLSAAASLALDWGPGGASLTRAAALLSAPGVGWNLGFLIAMPTLGSYVAMYYFQPRVDPSRAALIYLAEPVFAAIFACALAGRTMGLTAIVGAGLILAANVVVTWLEGRGKDTAQGARRTELQAAARTP